MIFLGIYGDQFPLYFPECVAQFPLSGKDHIVVSSNLNLSGASIIKTSPSFSVHYTSMVFICLLKIFTQILNNSKHFSRDFIFITSIFLNIIHRSHLFHPPLHLQFIYRSQPFFHHLYILGYRANF